MQGLGRWYLLFNPEEGLEVKIPIGGDLHRRYVPRVPEGLDLFCEIVLSH